LYHHTITTVEQI